MLANGSKLDFVMETFSLVSFLKDAVLPLTTIQSHGKVLSPNKDSTTHTSTHFGLSPSSCVWKPLSLHHYTK